MKFIRVWARLVKAVGLIEVFYCLPIYEAENDCNVIGSTKIMIDRPQQLGEEEKICVNYCLLIVFSGRATPNYSQKVLFMILTTFVVRLGKLCLLELTPYYLSVDKIRLVNQYFIIIPSY